MDNYPHLREEVGLPVLEEKEEKEEKKRGAPVVVGSASRGGGWLSRLFGLGGRSPVGRRTVENGLASAWRRGFLPGLAYLLSYRGGLALLPVALGAALITIYALGGLKESREDGTTFLKSDEASAAPSSPAAATSGPSSLNMFMNANRRSVDKVADRKGLKGSDSGMTSEAPADKPAGEQSPTSPPEQPVAARDADKASKKFIVANFFASKGLGFGNGLAGGSGLSGGIMRPFEKPKDPVKTSSFRGNVQASKTQTRSLKPVANLKGSMNQLVFVSGQSLKARNATVAETQASQANQAFEKESVQAGGNVIGAGGGPTSGQGTDVLGQGGGGPIDSTSITPPTQVPSIASAQDNTPYNNLIYVGVALLMTASLLIIIGGIVAAMAKIFPPLMSIAQMLIGMAMALAAAAAGMGLMVANTYGQQQQGLVLTVGGSITSAAALAALIAPPEIAPIIAVIGGVAGLVGAMLSLLMGHRV